MDSCAGIGGAGPAANGAVSVTALRPEFLYMCDLFLPRRRIGLIGRDLLLCGSCQDRQDVVCKSKKCSAVDDKVEPLFQTNPLEWKIFESDIIKIRYTILSMFLCPLCLLMSMSL